MNGSPDLGRRVPRALRALATIAVAIPLGAVGLAVVLVLLLGAALSALWIGLPLVLGALAAGRWLADVDRRAANRLLDAHIAPMPRRVATTGSPWRRALAILGDPAHWRMFGMLALQLPVALVALVAGLAPLGVCVALVVLGLSGITGAGEVEFVGPAPLNVLSGLIMLLLAVPAAILAVAVLETLGRALRRLCESMLSTRRAAAGPVREMLAESLGDRTLSIAYWLPDREVFVDEAGRPVVLPDRGSGRAWTAVERDGRRVAAIVHDAALETGPELVQAAAAAAALALDNERLKADLRARVEELRVSRVRIVEAADAARRRLERDLHDGAQQQLVSLALDLRLLKARVRGGEAEPLVDELAAKLAVALSELRELARGIHPAILTDRGLGPAIEALASRVPLDVTSEVSIEERLAPPVEAAAYFVVAEGLTNIVKYAGATGARVEIGRTRDAVEVSVADDGVGGARVGGGTGLRGLEDRLAALDGSLTVDSPPGGGTRLRARIPLRTEPLLAEVHENGGAPAEARTEPRP